MGRLTPPQLLILSFLSAIILGTVLLSLPAATQGAGRIPLVDGIFTATSATCVTGLVVRDTGTYFTPFGRWVIFALFQAGGLGIMTFSTLFAVLLGRRLGILESDVVRSTLDNKNIIGLKKLIIWILGITILAETAGGAALFLRWRSVTDWGVLETAEKAVFHSVSAFCNAGLSLFRTSFEAFTADPVINLIMITLIVAGGIGFIVIAEIAGMAVRPREKKKRLSFHSRVVLITTGVLIVSGAVFIYLSEAGGDLYSGMGPAGRAWGALFQSVTARTAGFNTLPVDRLAAPTLLLIMFLMFVGASPGSTGGGIKTSTFAVLFATVGSMFRNKRRIMMLGRSVPRQVLRESLVIFFMAATWIFVFTAAILCSEKTGAFGTERFMNVLFEVFSAFGTVGLSTGITPDLNDVSKLCIIATMFAGRLGPLTLALAVASRKSTDKYLYPEEQLMVG